jgi:hypothetical protein
MPKQTLQHNVLMRSIKLVDIGFLNFIYIGLAVVCAKIVDHTIGEFDEKDEKKKSFTRVSVEMFVAVWLYGVLVYTVRNVVPLIPFPLHGFHGFDHFRVKELGVPTVFTLTFLIFSSYLRNKLLYYYKRLGNKDVTFKKNNNVGEY